MHKSKGTTHSRRLERFIKVYFDSCWFSYYQKKKKIKTHLPLCMIELSHISNTFQKVIVIASVDFFLT